MECPCELNGITCDGINCEIKAEVDKMDFSRKREKKPKKYSIDRRHFKIRTIIEV